MQRSAVIAVLLAALALAGCGPFGGKSDEDQVRDTVDQLVTARNQSHFADVCSLFASAQLAQFKKANTTCEKFLQQHAAPDTTTTIRVEQVRVEGDRATVDREPQRGRRERGVDPAGEGERGLEGDPGRVLKVA
jgi:hypothetical protein